MADDYDHVDDDDDDDNNGDKTYIWIYKHKNYSKEEQTVIEEEMNINPVAEYFENIHEYMYRLYEAPYSFVPK